ncbi:hypothetical protein B9T11_02030 [Wohlfahrtiimonas chitiniclastica]|uniref:OsmC family protein n=1 Tax=Wohlfahrtiimonas chitiniclastica TaxID=400946 RepID=UPI000B98029F|nr:OsmC family protein [Wohlfahrtiimonas chitiniclastica]MBS7836542.1 OsmC family protein [Wohlfahrtiimonas chitiniclastica]MBS7838393.1 OsmC family protein [Wohlfahrtiimonas chitiniclastica]OYQ82938.1 hypothetical protein B9T11_02030 [Wohlfahrtiimonas chitiniclastica]OYQ85029.1 hypothetical protein B9T14_00715 [Wohlfahrtiimonas chitiniclastica]OYQ86737.1 hypothetical protein B9T15_04325 [Wohlfahrtiimonas chitiniclastica]
MSDNAAKVYQARTTITDGFQVKIEARDHTLYFDEPKPFGEDTGMTPVEGLLGAIGACKSIVAKVTAKQMGIEYRSIEVLVEGDFDARGYQGDPDVAIGFSDIRTTYVIDSDASEEKLKQLMAFVDAHCPVAATIKDSAPMSSTLRR